MKGITAYIKNNNDGTSKLVLDDVASKSKYLDSWEKLELYTHKTYSSKQLSELELSQEQLAEIGQNLIIRLLALNGAIK